MQPQLIISFEHLSEGKFVIRSETIATSLPNKLSFPLPWAPGVPLPAEIQADVAAYQTVFQDAKDGDRAKIKVRTDKRSALTRKFKRVASYLELAADGDVSKLATTGFELRHDIVKSMVHEP